MTSLRRSLRGWLAIAAFLGGLSLPFASARHFWGTDDPACGQTSVYGAQTTAKYASAAPGTGGSHCTLCHWQRAVGGASTTANQTVVVWLTATDTPLFFSSDFIPSIVQSERPSRAPPSVV